MATRKAEPERELTDKEHNDQFKVMEFQPSENLRVEVYLLPQHAWFRGFGGTRGGLTTGTTPSLIVRTSNKSWGFHDTEYDLADKETWLHIVDGLRNAFKRES